MFLTASAIFFFSFQRAGLPCIVEREAIPTPSAPLQEKNYSQSDLLWTPGFLTSPAYFPAVLQLELRCLQQEFFQPQKVTIAKQ